MWVYVGMYIILIGAEINNFRIKKVENLKNEQTKNAINT